MTATLKAGDSFRFADGRDGGHLWFVISSGQLDPVVVVSVTTWRADKDQNCVLEVDDHPFLKHKSCIAYDLAKSVSQEKLQLWIERSELQFDDPVSPEILFRLLDGAAASRRIPIKCRSVLEDQGLI